MAGRPTALTEELATRAKGYLPTCIGVLPTIEGLALFLGVSKQSIYTWCDQDDELGQIFLDVFERIKNEQGMRLINGGLYGQFNATITKLMLSKHGYIEKQETESKEEVTHKFQGLTDEQLDGAIKAAKDRIS